MESKDVQQLFKDVLGSAERAEQPLNCVAPGMEAGGAGQDPSRAQRPFLPGDLQLPGQGGWKQQSPEPRGSPGGCRRGAVPSLCLGKAAVPRLPPRFVPPTGAVAAAQQRAQAPGSSSLLWEGAQKLLGGAWGGSCTAKG